MFPTSVWAWSVSFPKLRAENNDRGVTYPDHRVASSDALESLLRPKGNEGDRSRALHPPFFLSAHPRRVAMLSLFITLKIVSQWHYLVCSSQSRTLYGSFSFLAEHSSSGTNVPVVGHRLNSLHSQIDSERQIAVSPFYRGRN